MPALTSTAQEAHQAHLLLLSYEFPTVPTAHEALQLRCKSNLAKGVTHPLKSMTQEESRQRPKVRKKVSWWKPLMISKCEKLGSESGSIEEGRFSNE